MCAISGLCPKKAFHNLSEEILALSVYKYVGDNLKITVWCVHKLTNFYIKIIIMIII